MSTAPRYLPHYTLADYQQWEGDWELWQGIPVTIPHHFAPHQICAVKIMSSLSDAIEAEKCPAVVLPAIDWIISENTVVRPDILVLCGDVPQRHVTESPALVVEILSPATADRDRNEKLALYQDHGVRYYLIADPNDGMLEAYHQNAQGVFERFEPADDWEFTVCNDCHIRLNMESIW